MSSDPPVVQVPDNVRPGAVFKVVCLNPDTTIDGVPYQIASTTLKGAVGFLWTERANPTPRCTGPHVLEEVNPDPSQANSWYDVTFAGSRDSWSLHLIQDGLFRPSSHSDPTEHTESP